MKQDTVNKFKEILKNMDYGTNFERTADLESLFKNCTDNILSFADEKCNNFVEVQNLVSGEFLIKVPISSEDFLNHVPKPISLSYYQRNHIIIKLIDEILDAIDIICDIELITRGILVEDTKKAIAILIRTLQSFIGIDKFATQQIYKEYLPSNYFLGDLGFALGNAISKEFSLTICTVPETTLIASFICKLCVKADYPKEAIKVETVPSDANIHEALKSAKYVSPSVPILIFNDADLDSACLAAANGIWAYQGNLPWAIRTILVQEDILDEFTRKFRDLTKKLNFGLANNILADFALPTNPAVVSKRNDMVKKAALLGIKVIQRDMDTENAFLPTLFFGAYVYDKNKLSYDVGNFPHATVLAFRNSSEAVSLANDCDPFYASVWTENGSLSNEVANKLHANNVWINSYNVDPANIRKRLDTRHLHKFCEDLPNREAVKKAQEVWKKLSLQQRVVKMYQLLSFSDELSKNHKGFTEDEKKCMKKFTSTLQEVLSEFQANAPAFTLQTPLNIVYITDDLDIYKFTCLALLYGNAVVLRTSKESFRFFTEGLINQSVFPVNLVSIVNSEDNPNSSRICSAQVSQIMTNEQSATGIHNFCNIKNICQN